MPKETTMETIIEQTQQDLARAEYAESTQARYLKTIGLFLSRQERPIEEVGRDDVRRFVDELAARGKSASTMKMHLAALIFLFAKTLGRPTEVSFIKFPRQRSPLPTILSPEEVGRLFEAIHHRRYQAIAMVIYGTGVRLDEALWLQVEDIDGLRGVIRVRHGKGDKPRDVKLTPTLLGWLRTYWGREQPPKPYLFSSRTTGKPPTQDTVRAALARAGEQAGISKPVRPHVLRHCYATHLHEQGVELCVLQALMGHANVQTTARYVRASTKLIEKTPSPLDLLPHFGPRR
jgi:integrase/recombinase XerD